ncbi:MAG: MaoC family dehydratase N-terminal domain-containing protein, partial [Chloroflexota bacterium]
MVDSTAVQRYYEAWEIGNPLYWDEKVAKQAGYWGLVVPWSAFKQTVSYKGSLRAGDATRFPPAMDRNATARLGSF